MKTNICVVFITAPKGAKSKNIAKKIVQERLAACVNIVPSLTSIYQWKKKIVQDGEALLIIKTKKPLVSKLINFVQKIHPYSVPEVIALPVIAGNHSYVKWVNNETK